MQKVQLLQMTVDQNIMKHTKKRETFLQVGRDSYVLALSSLNNTALDLLQQFVEMVLTQYPIGHAPECLAAHNIPVF